MKKKSLIIYGLILLAVLITSLLWYSKSHNRVEISASQFDNLRYPVHGIDLSHHNPILNPQTFTYSNLSFAYFKASEGNLYADRNYIYNMKEARSAGIPAGAYHFFSFDVPGADQAAFFLSTADNKVGDLLPAIDVEHSSSNRLTTGRDYINTVVRELKAMEQTLFNALGSHPVIYTNKECFRLYIKDSFPDNPLWICDLTDEPSVELYPNWLFWQFSHNGIFNDKNEKTNLDYFRYSIDHLNYYTIK